MLKSHKLACVLCSRSISDAVEIVSVYLKVLRHLFCTLSICFNFRTYAFVYCVESFVL